MRLTILQGGLIFGGVLCLIALIDYQGTDSQPIPAPAPARSSKDHHASRTEAPEFDRCTTLTAERRRTLTAQHLPFGVPERDKPETIRIRRGYATSYDAGHRVPAWSAYRIERSFLVGHVEREGRLAEFHPDAQVTDPVEADDYDGLSHRLNLDRGHLAPWRVMGGDRDHDGTLGDRDPDDACRIYEANLMSNVAPQYGTTFNRAPGLWNRAEQWVQDELVEEAGRTVWEVSGTLFAAAAEPSRVGPHRDIAVPDGFYKITVVLPLDETRPELYAFCFPHTPDGEGRAAVCDPGCRIDQALERCLTTVATIEKLAGWRFFDGLPPEARQRLETTDTARVWATWGRTENERENRRSGVARR